MTTISLNDKQVRHPGNRAIVYEFYLRHKHYREKESR